MALLVELKTYPGYKPEEVADFFDQRGWSVEFLFVSRVGLVSTDLGAAIECIDGRYANLTTLTKHGPKIPGGFNAIAALKTGSGAVGFNAAAQEAKRLGFRAGTHGNCGFFRLWQENRLEAAKYSLILPKTPVRRFGLPQWIKDCENVWGGAHFHLPGSHEERMLVFNPFIGITLVPDAARFEYDDWFMRELGIHPRRAMRLAAETIEQLKPDAMHLEIIVP